MARAIIMPSVGMYTAEGTLMAWLRPAGAMVDSGEAIAEINTEKSTFEIVAPAAGFLHHVVEVGANLQVEAVMGYILAEGEAPPTSEVEQLSSRMPGADQAITSPTPKPLQPADTTVIPSTTTSGRATDVRASPIAKRLAAQHGIDLTCVAGSGPGGRIVEADVLAEAARHGRGEASDTTPEARRIRQRVPLAGMRRTIAERLRHSLATAVSLTVTREVCADNLVAARTYLAEKIGNPLSYDALFIKLLATALREHPELNSTIENDTIIILDEVHIGFAVAMAGGLIVPVIRDADQKSLVSVAAQVRDLSERARSGQLLPEDVGGGTVTITNLGGYGIDAFTPILNPPQSAILGIGRIAPRPVVRDGLVVAGLTCVLSLTFDHRVADGVPAALLLDVIARLMTDEQYFTALT
jgi:pyruvate/2-oxoglutarate dehydrogenase complex dihydrolipoamide acyltransferase (E2) component